MINRHLDFFNFLFTINKLEYLRYIVTGPHTLKDKNFVQHDVLVNIDDEYNDNQEVIFNNIRFESEQYYDVASYNSVKNSEILQDKTTIALALYNHPGFDRIEIKNKLESEKKYDIQFKLKRFELNKNGYIAELENGSKIITIVGEDAYIVIPHFMNSKIRREKDTKVGTDSGILGYKSNNPARKSEVKFNIIVMLDAAADIDNLFKVKGKNTGAYFVQQILSVIKQHGSSAGYRICSEQKDYTKFIVDENTFKIMVTKESTINYYAEKKYHLRLIDSITKTFSERVKSSIIGKICDTVIEVFCQSCGKKVQVNGKENLELNLTQKGILMNGEVLKKAQNIAKNTAEVKVSVRDNNIEMLARRVESAKSEEVRDNKVELPESKEVRRKKYLQEKFQHAAKEFGKAGTQSNYPGVPKEQQLSIDLGNKPVFGIVSKILHWVENKFKYFFPRYNLFPEVGNEDRKIPGTNSQVKYFTSDEQAEHTIHSQKKDGKKKLYNVKGELYDTADKVSKGRKGCVAYVITLDGKLITHEHVNVGESEYAYRHSTLAGGGPVICSGLMEVKNGQITYMDNNSGHYKPRSANLYNAIKNLEDVFSENAKIVHFGGWFGFIKEIPILCRIIPGKEESIDGFQKRLDKKGKSGLTKVEEYFQTIRKYNMQYKQKLLLGNYKSPTSELPNNPAIHEKRKVKFSSYIKHCKFLKEFDEDPRVKKVTIEHSIREIIGANIGHKPRVELAKKGVGKNEKVGINIIFCHGDDHERFITLLDYQKYNHTSSIVQERDNAQRYIVFVDEKSADKFIRNTLKIDRFTGTVLSELELLHKESDNRTI